ncbi:MAG: DUF2786 domain-containing protein [Gammaproteobacteria bacterium]|nr:DUF2786 domain-containing protein [Gammaproteobacteria bacterium]
MVSKRDKAVDRIRKLLRLAENAGSVSEAKTAAAQAAALMAKHGIESVEEEREDSVTDNRDLVVDVSKGKRVAGWKWMLAWFVGEIATCKPYRLHRMMGTKIVGTVIAFIGRRSDAEMASYVLQYLLTELAAIHKKNRPPIGQRIQQYIPGQEPPVVDKPYQRRWTRDFYAGAISVIHQRMLEAQQSVYDAAADRAGAAAANLPPGSQDSIGQLETALVLLGKVSAQVDEVAGDLGLQYVDAPERQILSPQGFAAGMRAGQGVELEPPQDRAALPSDDREKP